MGFRGTAGVVSRHKQAEVCPIKNNLPSQGCGVKVSEEVECCA